MDSPRAADDAGDATPRANPKRLLVAAVAAGVATRIALAAATWWWLQPDAASKKVRRAVASAAPRHTLPASAASSAAPAAAVVAPGVAPATPVVGAAQAASAAVAEHAVAAATTSTPTPARRDEAPMDRLQRRLAEVLGPSVSVAAAHPGELRVLNRSAVAASAAARPWGYADMTGPRRWARLDPAYASCGSGREQSPIDLRGGVVQRLEPVHFDYHAGRFGVLDTGHTVQVKAPPGNAIEFGGARYELQQLHVHRPSEERIDGRQFEMGVHLVHRDAAGRLAVVAVLLQRGAVQPLLQAVWQQLAPAVGDDDRAALAEIDPNQLLPQERRYYSYMGSLTTPPCTEGVRWLVLRQPLTVSAQQIDAFAQRYPANARPLQPAAGRQIQQSM